MADSKPKLPICADYITQLRPASCSEAIQSKEQLDLLFKNISEVARNTNVTFVFNKNNLAFYRAKKSR